MNIRNYYCWIKLLCIHLSLFLLQSKDYNIAWLRQRNENDMTDEKWRNGRINDINYKDWKTSGKSDIFIDRLTPVSSLKYLMIYFKHNRTHSNYCRKDLVHIVNVSDDTFYSAEIILIFGIILPILGMFHLLFLVLFLILKTSVDYVVKNISIIIVAHLYIL